MTPIAIVGPTGVLGRALAPLLLEQGLKLRLLGRSPEKMQALFPQVADAHAFDLLSTQDEARLPGLLEGCSAVLHIATAIPKDMSRPGTWEANTRLRTEGVRRLLEAALQAGVERYLQQSITMAYPDRGDEWITEETPLDASPERAGVNAPVIEMEAMIRAIPTGRLGWTILRGSSFVGPGTFQEDLIEELRAGRVRVPGRGRSYLSLVCVSDVARAFAAALAVPCAGMTFNITAPPLRQGDYLDSLAEAAGAPRPERDPSLPCPPSWRCSSAAAKAVSGWEARQAVIPD